MTSHTLLQSALKLNEEKLVEVTREMNWITDESLLNGGMLSEGRYRASLLRDRIEGLLMICKKLMQESHGVANSIRVQREKDEKFQVGFESFAADQRIRVKANTEDLGKFLNLARNSVSSFKAYELPKDGHCKAHAGLVDLYKHLYIFLYYEKEATFDINLFVNIACGVGHEDFQKRLATFDIANFTIEIACKLKEVKEVDFSEFSKNDTLIDQLRWTDFIYQAYLSYVDLQKKEQEQRDLNITKDEKIVQLSVAKKIQSQEQQTNLLFDNYLSQLMDIRDKIDNMLKSTDYRNSDMKLLEMKQINGNLQQTVSPPFNVYR